MIIQQNCANDGIEGANFYWNTWPPGVSQGIVSVAVSDFYGSDSVDSFVLVKSTQAKSLRASVWVCGKI